MSVYYHKGVVELSKENLTPQNVQQNPQTSRIVINAQGGFNVLSFDEIISIQAVSGNYVFFFTTHGKKVLCTKPLNYFESQLAPFLFYRVHRSFIANLRFIESYNTIKGEVKMVDKSVLPVAVRRKANFLKLIKSTFV